MSNLPSIDAAREALRTHVLQHSLKTGEFTLKSGRISPYFFNAGEFNRGIQLAQLGECYAAKIVESGIQFDGLFGPAYKGIPLGAATAVSLSSLHHKNVPFAFNRKEAKDHGEGGTLVGAALKGRVLIVDDVMSAGTAARESIELILKAGATAHAIAIALDRQDMATEVQADGSVKDVPHSAVQYVRNTLGMSVCFIAQLSDLLAYLSTQSGNEMGQHLPKVQAYRDRYGV